MKTISQLETPTGFTVTGYYRNFMDEKIPIKRIFVTTRPLALKVAAQLRRDPLVDSVGIAATQQPAKSKGDSHLRQFLDGLKQPVVAKRRKKVTDIERFEATDFLKSTKKESIQLERVSHKEFYDDNKAFELENTLEPCGIVPPRTPTYYQWAALQLTAYW